MSTDLTIPAVCGVHAYADKFPMLSDDELAELAESVAANGLRVPIVLTADGLVLDGRNRLKACGIAGVEPTFEVYDGDDLAEYVIDANNRRNIKTSQRAMSTALVLAADGRRVGGRWAYGAQKLGNVGNQHSSTWREAISRCGLVIDHAPDLAEQVRDGEMALDVAVRQAEAARDAERRKLEEGERLAAEEADAKAFVKANAPELAALVGDTFQSFAEAQAVWEKRNREEAARISREKREKAERKKAERDARSDLYSGMARGLLTVSAFGKYDDIPKLMSEYDSSELHPTQYEQAFTAEELRAAMHFIEGLAEFFGYGELK